VVHAHQHQAAQREALQLKARQLVQWLEDQDVVAILLGPGSHEQVIKRSPGILKFLAEHNKLSVHHVDLLWSIVTGKHENQVRIVHDALADLTSALSEDHLDALNARISERDLRDYHEYDLNFVRLFTVNAVKKDLSEPSRFDQPQDTVGLYVCPACCELC
jgi:hypothetical protein